MPLPDRYVLFADILGFGDLVTSRPLEVEQLKPVLDIPDNFTALHEWPWAYDNTNRLVEVFQNFHRAFDYHVHHHRRDNDVIAMSFSDSAFVSFDDLHLLCGFARGLMRALIGMFVPCRLGIAAGSITPLRFLSDNTDTLHIHASQFTGTGVVKAFYAAEKNGIRGLGIFLHDSVQQKLAGSTNRLQSVSNSQNGVYAQLDYVYKLWENYEILPKPARIDRLKRKLAQMKRLAPEDKAPYYDFALSSLAVMIEAARDDEA